MQARVRCKNRLPTRLAVLCIQSVGSVRPPCPSSCRLMIFVCVGGRRVHHRGAPNRQRGGVDDVAQIEAASGARPPLGSRRNRASNTPRRAPLVAPIPAPSSLGDEHLARRGLPNGSVRALRNSPNLLGLFGICLFLLFLLLFLCSGEILRMTQDGIRCKPSDGLGGRLFWMVRLNNDQG